LRAAILVPNEQTRDRLNSPKCLTFEFIISRPEVRRAIRMGEAKRRKETDPNYGRIPKAPNYRGLVVSPPMRIEGRSIQTSGNLDPQELRFALLFWDRLVLPSSRAIRIDGGNDAHFLETAGILKRIEYAISGDVAQGIARGQIETFRNLERGEPGVWALSQGEKSFLLKEGVVDEGTGASVELLRAIPIPKHDVPLMDILEFKQRRQDELLRLRFQLDSFVAAIDAAEDRPTELEKRIAEIDKSCADLLTLGKEWQFPFYVSDFKASVTLNLGRAATTAIATWKLAESYSLQLATVAATIGGVASTLDIKPGIGLRSIKRPLSAYRYVYQVHDELR
jgi:hypothetical protein